MTTLAVIGAGPKGIAIDAGDKQVVVTIEYGDERERVAYDLVVVAVGFHARWFERPHPAPVCPVGGGGPHRPGKGNT